MCAHCRLVFVLGTRGTRRARPTASHCLLPPSHSAIPGHRDRTTWMRISIHSYISLRLYKCIYIIIYNAQTACTCIRSLSRPEGCHLTQRKILGYAGHSPHSFLQVTTHGARRNTILIDSPHCESLFLSFSFFLKTYYPAILH